MSETHFSRNPPIAGRPRQQRGMIALLLLRVTLIGCALALIGTLGSIAFKALA